MNPSSIVTEFSKGMRICLQAIPKSLKQSNPRSQRLNLREQMKIQERPKISLGRQENRKVESLKLLPKKS